jgi:hypothetical protein
VLEEPLPAATWSAPRGIPEARRAAIRQALVREQDIQVGSGGGESNAVAAGKGYVLQQIGPSRHEDDKGDFSGTSIGSCVGTNIWQQGEFWWDWVQGSLWQGEVVASYGAV